MERSPYQQAPGSGPDTPVFAILKKLAEGLSLTSEEEEMIQQWKSHSLHRSKLVEDLVSAKKKAASLVKLQDIETGMEKNLRDFLGTVRDERGETASEFSERRPVRFSWPKRMLPYAAALVLAFTVIIYFLHDRRNESAFAAVEENAKKNQPADQVKPGREGAILTLADGRKIVLDTAGNGLLAEEGGTALMLNNGQLRYNAGTGKQASLNTVETPKGRHFQIILPDGTRVWLNAASVITYPTVFESNERSVEVSGEVYFEVTKNEVQPFIVRTRQMTIEVLGTEFNVNAYADDEAIKTTLIEGSVNIKKGDRQQLLRPGQQAIVEKGDRAAVEKMIRINEHVNVDQVVAWKNGLFHFVDADIKTVMQQLGRWYDLEVVYEGEIPSRRFEGKMQRNLILSDVLELFSRMGIQFRVENKKLTVYSNKKE